MSGAKLGMQMQQSEKESKSKLMTMNENAHIKSRLALLLNFWLCNSQLGLSLGERLTLSGDDAESVSFSIVWSAWLASEACDSLSD